MSSLSHHFPVKEAIAGARYVAAGDGSVLAHSQATTPLIPLGSGSPGQPE